MMVCGNACNNLPPDIGAGNRVLKEVCLERKIVKCYHNPNEIGSLLKRVILDKRGNDGKSV
jgi:hypothetical protein